MTPGTTAPPSLATRLAPGVLVVLGVCAGALGASGFHHPIGSPDADREPGSMALFLGGSLALGIGGFLVRVQRRRGAEQGASTSAKRETLERVAHIRDTVRSLYERMPELDAPTAANELSGIIEGELFDLTSSSEEFLARVGFKDYAAIWDGVATGERLLARAWSMCTDGFPDEGREELGHALAAFERALSPRG